MFIREKIWKVVSAAGEEREKERERGRRVGRKRRGSDEERRIGRWPHKEAEVREEKILSEG